MTSYGDSASRTPKTSTSRCLPFRWIRPIGSQPERAGFARAWTNAAEARIGYSGRSRVSKGTAGQGDSRRLPDGIGPARYQTAPCSWSKSATVE